VQQPWSNEFGYASYESIAELKRTESAGTTRDRVPPSEEEIR